MKKNEYIMAKKAAAKKTKKPAPKKRTVPKKVRVKAAAKKTKKPAPKKRTVPKKVRVKAPPKTKTGPADKASPKTEPQPAPSSLGAVVGGTDPCTCGHSPEEHGHDADFPGSTGCIVCVEGDCDAYEADPLIE